MNPDELPEQDWDPKADEVQRDQRAAYDAMRERCPVAYSDFLGWTLFRHADVMRALHDPDTFSSVVSRHLSVPSGMDPPEHTDFRTTLNRYFEPQQMAAFEPHCRRLAQELAAELPADGEVELIGQFTSWFAVRAQCSFLGWPQRFHEKLYRWVQKNHTATLAGDRPAMTRVAYEFQEYVEELLQERRDADAGNDLTTRLVHDQVAGRLLRNEEIVSILRNWTVGEVGTISAAIGILVHYLAQHPQLQRRLRAEPQLLAAANDEILRLHGPLVTNRRVTTGAVRVGERRIGSGQRVTLNWVAANRDPAVFEQPDEFRLERDPAANLLYGAGIHVCPGAPLARLELRVVMEELLARTTAIELVPGRPPAPASYPASGYASLPLQVRCA
ncbi:MAG: cytochrome P450 [Burkholderiaceae bacterium]